MQRRCQGGQRCLGYLQPRPVTGDLRTGVASLWECATISKTSPYLNRHIMNSSANWRISTTCWVPGHNGRLDQRSDSDTNGRKLTGVAILFKPGQIFVTHWIFGSSAKQAKQGWQGLEMQLEGAFLGRRARLWVIFGRQARLELSRCVHLVHCCWYHLATRLTVENTFDRQKKCLWPGELAVWNTLIEKNTVVPVHGDCLDNQSIDQAKQKEVNQTHGHGLISSDLSFNSDPVTHCHCYSCCRKIYSHKFWLTIGSAIYVAYQWSKVTAEGIFSTIICFAKWISVITRSRLVLRWVTKTTIFISNPKQTQICSFMAPIAFLEFSGRYNCSLIWNGPVLWLSPCRQVVKYFAASFVRIEWLCLLKISRASEPTWKQSTISFINLTCS